MYTWFDGYLGKPELKLTQAQVDACSHSGDCTADVEAVAQEPEIAAQLATFDAYVVMRILKETGAWSNKELKDHAENLRRLLWIACNDVSEQPELYSDDRNA